MHARGSLAVVCVLLGIASAPACRSAETRASVPSYDNFTRQLIQLNADQNGDGRIDQWSFFAGNRPLRGEADTDADGRIDRWEYFDEQSALTRVGTSSQNDGIEDTWTWVTPANGESRVDHARHRDRQVDRREYYRAGALVRAEEDTNADGRLDRWDRYEGGILRQADFDTTRSTGRPNRRLLYDAQGHFLRVEADPELDGTFVVISGATPANAMNGGKQ
jgi:hypothetical protein